MRIPSMFAKACWVVLALAALGAIHGCKKPPGFDKKAENPDTKALPEKITATLATYTFYEAKPMHPLHLQFTAEVSTFNLGANSVESIRGRYVKGTLYQKGVRAISFSGDAVNATKPKIGKAKAVHPVLALKDRPPYNVSLDGHVVLVRLSDGMTLKCDHLNYDQVNDILKARGDVQVGAPTGVSGTLPEIWATPDLRYFATPKLFNLKP